MTSSPLRAGADLTEQLEWYKTQYSQLEADLSDFQASSKDLEEQLEKDVEAAEKNERKFKQQVEKLNFEVDEWKTKHKQAKDEANRAQNALQKEITTMREEVRSLQLRLRDTEVMNDDYERQARNTEYEKDDLEGKYNAAIERGVLLEETVRIGEQEREGLRVETQRLRDELSDLKVEADITLEKLRLAEQTIEELRSRGPSASAFDHLRARSPASEASGLTPLSPSASTPPPKSENASDAPTPPSPPLSDAPANGNLEQQTPVPMKRRSRLPEAGMTPRPVGAVPRHSRGASLASSTSTAVSGAMRPPSKLKISRAGAASDRLPRSDSLHQIRGLIGRMQKIEERVHSARSKLPAPGTPRGSPRAGSALGDIIPSSVTVRRSSKRPSASTASSIAHDDDPDSSPTNPLRRGSQLTTPRLPLGIPRPPSALSRSEHSPSAIARTPSSSVVSYRPSSRAEPRPPSRSGARTELGFHSNTSSSSSAPRKGSNFSRPRTSMSGNYAGVNKPPTQHRLHRSTTSISGRRRTPLPESEDSTFATPERRSTMERGSALPTPSSSRLPPPSILSKSVGPGVLPPLPVTKPRTNTVSSRSGHRFSPSPTKKAGEMMPPPRRRQTSEVGETF